MRDFTSRSDIENSNPGPSRQSSDDAEPATFSNGVKIGGDQTASGILKKSISSLLGPLGVSGVSFAEPKEIVDARAHIRGRENTFMHVTDGTPTGSLCGSTVQHAPPQGAPACPVCELLDC
ncbi:hypothetical protein ACI2LF_24390 [Kribbella sp. NPDC020789]